MIHRPIRHVRRAFQTFRLRRRSIALLFLAAALGSTATLADPGDFQAMPGLWKIVTSIVSHGQVVGQSKTTWHCVDEGADPWVEFANIDIPNQTKCLPSNQHRRSTALDWTLSCPGNTSATGKGRVDFDSPEHYVASVAMKGEGDVVRVEGKRYAACTSPSD
ncbi:DUF3617 domain-containing protein [Rhodanobacter sp. BL-MT-08]